MNAARAWVVLAAAVIAYEIVAPDGELLSEEADRWIEKHPVLVRVAVAVIALHIVNAIPPRWDPLHQIAVHTRRSAR